MRLVLMQVLVVLVLVMQRMVVFVLVMERILVFVLALVLVMQRMVVLVVMQLPWYQKQTLRGRCRSGFRFLALVLTLP
jgi:hypothetical protein